MPADLRRRLLALPPPAARDVLGEAVLPERLVACGEPAFDENATLWSLSVPDPVARLGYAVREALLDPERVFTPEEAALIHEALSELGAPDSWPPVRARAGAYVITADGFLDHWPHSTEWADEESGEDAWLKGFDSDDWGPPP